MPRGLASPVWFVRLHPPQLGEYIDAESQATAEAKAQAAEKRKAQAAERRRVALASKPPPKSGRKDNTRKENAEPAKEKGPVKERKQKEGMAGVARLVENTNAAGEAVRCQGCVTHP